MYRRYAESQNWQVKIINEYRDWLNFGFKDVILEIKGDCVYGKLKSEAGIHEAKGITYNFFDSQQKRAAIAIVKVMPEPEELQIQSEDIKIRYGRC